MFAGKVLGGYESTFSREHLSHSEGANNTLTFRVFCLDNGEPLRESSNKRLVTTQKARRNFSICARYEGSVVYLAWYCRSWRFSGFTTEALALFLVALAIWLLPFPRNDVIEMKRRIGGRFCPCASNVL